MFSQKMISFKVAPHQRASLDFYLPRMTGYNRNKFLNLAVKFVLSALTAQYEYNDRTTKDGRVPFFILMNN